MDRGLGYVRKVTFGLLLGSALGVVPAQASVNDRPFFRADSIVIVFGASDFEEEGGVAPVVYDLIGFITKFPRSFLRIIIRIDNPFDPVDLMSV